MRGDPLEMLTTDPPPSASPPTSAAWISARAGHVLRSIVSMSSARRICSKEPTKRAPPMVLTRWSIRPNCAIAVSTRRLGRVSSSMEPRTAATSIPSARRPCSAADSATGSRPLITTEAPSRPRRRAHERPMLGCAVDPGTTATRSANRMERRSSAMAVIVRCGQVRTVWPCGHPVVGHPVGPATTSSTTDVP